MYDEPLEMTAVVKKFIKKQVDDFRKTREMPGSVGIAVSSFLASGVGMEAGRAEGRMGGRGRGGADSSLLRLQGLLHFAHARRDSRRVSGSKSPFFEM